MPVNNETFSTCGWIQLNPKASTSFSTYGAISTEGTGALNGFRLFAQNVTPTMLRFKFTVFNSTTSLEAISTNYTIPTPWVHVCGIKNTTHISIFLNGTYIATQAASGFTLVLNNTGYPFQIGTYDSSTSFDLNGSVDRVYVYNRSLTAAEVLALYNNQTISTTGLVAEYLFNEVNQTLASNVNNYNITLDPGRTACVGFYNATAHVNKNITVNFTVPVECRTEQCIYQLSANLPEVMT